MSSLVGALLFARAVDDPEESKRILHSMRRMLRNQFVDADPSDKPTVSPPPPSPRNSLPHDLLRPF
jgi:hypothetical protein